MCQEWADSFSAFMRDMGECPAGFSIERNDNDGNYEPGNCKWASAAAQNRNKSSNVKIDYCGKSWVMSDLADHLGIKRTLFRRFYVDIGKPLEEIISFYQNQLA